MFNTIEMPYSTTTFSESQIIRCTSRERVRDHALKHPHHHKRVRNWKVATKHAGAIKPDNRFPSLRERAPDDKEVEPFLFWNP
jgi:hypothetical protein